MVHTHGQTAHFQRHRLVDEEAAVWSGHCDAITAAADAPTLDEFLAKISAMALDLLPETTRR